MSKDGPFSPVWRHETTYFIVEIHGNESRYTSNPERLAAMRTHADRIANNKTTTTYLHTARGPDAKGFKEILRLDQQLELYGDGVILTEPRSCISQTADCPTLVLYNETTDKLVCVHAGRPACTPDKDGLNIIDTALAEIIDTAEPQFVTAVIVGGIGGSYFEHNADAIGELLAQPFLDHYGDTAFTNPNTLSIDLVKLLIWQLTQAGIPNANIIHDGLCTYANRDLSSYRQSRSRTHANTIIVVKK